MDEFGKLSAYHKITAHWVFIRLPVTVSMFTEFGGGTRAPFPNSGWKSTLTEESGWFDLSTISKTRLTLTNQYIFRAESFNQYILCVRITTYPRAV